MDHLVLADVAVHSGVDLQSVATFVDAGILVETDSGGFRPPDIARARLVAALIEAGLSLTDLSEAIQDGRLSLSYVDLLMPDPVRLVSDRPIEREWLAFGPAISPILGIHRSPGEPIREDDLAILEQVSAAIDAGAPVERMAQIVRAMAHAASKLTDLQRDFIDEVLLAPAIERTGSPMRALEETSATRLRYREMGRELTRLLMDRFVDEAIFRNLVQFTEAALSSVGLDASESEQTVVFVDVSDYTGRSEREGDAESARQAVRLTDFARRLAAEHGGRMVKSLGDGAMMHAIEPHARAGDGHGGRRAGRGRGIVAASCRGTQRTDGASRKGTSSDRR